MAGVIFSILAGILISLQGVFNTRVSDRIGLLETTAVVHGIGFIFACIAAVLFGNGNIKRLGEVNKLYLMGGIFGVVIVFSVIKGISLLGATYSIAVLLVTQIVISTIIDTFGLFGNPQIKFDYTKPLGVLIMIAGIIVFKLRG